MMKTSRHKTLKTAVGVLLAVAVLAGAAAAETPDEKLFQTAKLLIFDKRWDDALERLDELIEKFPYSRLTGQAIFYKARCLKEQGDRDEQAMKVFREYILRQDASESLTEESELAIIDLAFRLVEGGRRSYADEIEKRLYRSNRVVKYYAAIKLSLVDDEKTARRSVSVLQQILKDERDEELRDRAKIALLRVDPEAYRDIGQERDEKQSRTFHFVVQNKWKRDPDFILNIPWSLADLALNAIPKDAKEDLRREGYDLDRIIRDLTRYRGKIIEIKTEKSVIKIWID